MQTLNEAVIYAVFQSGDIRRAMELVLDTYQDELYSYCVRLTGTHAANGIYQRILATAVQDLSSLVNSVSILAWLFEIARKIIIHYHQKKSHEFLGGLDPNYLPISGPQETENLSLQDPQLEELLKSLDPVTQEVLQLALWHNLAIFEIAQVIGLKPSKVRSIAATGLETVSIAGHQRNGLPS